MVSRSVSVINSDGSRESLGNVCLYLPSPTTAKQEHYCTYEGTKERGAIVKALRRAEVFLTCLYVTCLTVQ